ncbi:MAG: BolA/IbaG family iron-sulfur metabolism protein [Gammaproteobacteria bacterium]|nr:BolA/IbaG family iron-sulfur metabolism protein [Pseudomonadales bacterium]MCP5346374.1 BolA/IbaG family iron-sulfur metabolism protein [Pseudomonadales bacterium]
MSVHKAVQKSIEDKVQSALSPHYLTVENESHRHGGPATESHFKLTVVSEAFDGQLAVKRHRALYGLLSEELAGGVHALALHLYTPTEWATRQEKSPASPDCRGGSKADH